ncbi:hypothetical protein ACPVPU_07470 [Sphingomonas sp. CJ99]
MRVRIEATMLALLMLSSLICGCGSAPPPTAVENDQDRQLSTAAWSEPPKSAARFDPKKVAAAKEAILAEPKVRDLVFQDGKYDVEWQVGIIPDGTPRHGYAGYLCQTLSEIGLIDDDVSVRVIDIYAVERGADFRTASLGHVRCHDGANLGV